MVERPEVSLVIPLYDEEESLPVLAERIASVCDEAGLSFEIWFVDDGSRDASWKVIQGLVERDGRIHGVSFQRNYGKSAALAVGFERARGRYVITMDADLQDDPAEIPHLVSKLEAGYDLVSGWKQKRQDPLGKTIPSRFFNFVTRRLSGIPLHDFNCGLKGYRNEVVKSVHVYGELHRYIPLLAYWEGFHRITEIKVVHHARRFGRTKFGLSRFIKGFLDLLTVQFLTRFTARPMHFFGTIGSLAFIAGFVISLWLSVEKLFLGRPIGDRPLLLLGVTMILVGVQMFTTGLIGEMVVVPRMARTAEYRVAGEVGADADPAMASAAAYGA